MFGRRRRVAPVIQAPAPLPELSNEQVFELLCDRLDGMVGTNGRWTLVPRQDDDTDVIFHSLKSREIAGILTDVLREQTAALRGEHAGEPSALPWMPAPITSWVDPELPSPVLLPTHADSEDARLVA